MLICSVRCIFEIERRGRILDENVKQLAPKLNDNSENIKSSNVVLSSTIEKISTRELPTTSFCYNLSSNKFVEKF